ncbi:RidA family protein [Bacillus sp. NPDC077027]|uniref:RidA family protein n=1 Tax=Bacillus sp. NPDC077027 TaxID=3390548 RepID=UPI003D013EE3
MRSVTEAGNLKSNGHYSLAMVHQHTVYVSGQFSIDPLTQEKKLGTFEEEMLQTLQNIELIVCQAGSNKKQIVQVIIYTPHKNQQSQIMHIFNEFFSGLQPLCSIVTTNELHYGFQLEIEAVAYISK